MDFQDLPIKQKITRVILLTATTVVLLTVAAFVATDYLSYRAWMVHNLASTSSILSGQLRDAPATPQAHSQILAALKLNPRIGTGGFFDESGRLLASYPSGTAIQLPETARHGRGMLKHRGVLSWHERLTLAGQPDLILYLESDTSPLAARVRLYALIALGILVLATLAAAVIGNTLQAGISGPILALVAKVRDVSGPAAPVPTLGRDEAALLTEAFDQMMAKLATAAEVHSFMVAIVASADLAIIGKTLDGKIVSWNTGATGMFGYEKPETIGKGIAELIVPTDKASEDQRILEAVRGGRVFRAETVLRRKDDTLVEVALVVSPVRSEEGQIMGASYMATDVSGRRRAERNLKESEARFSAIISSAMDAIISIDENQRVTIFNDAAERLFGCPRADAIGQPLDKFIPARFRAPHRHHVAQFGCDGTTTRAMGNLRPLSALRSNGEEFPIEASISQSTVNERKTYTVILRDITERNQVEEQARRFNAELEQRVKERTAALIAANREMESFTYSVAHDLRAPLRHIDAFSSILEEDFADQLPEEARQYLTNIQHGSRSMSRLVDDLLNLARVGRQELSYEEVSLENMVVEVSREMIHEAPGRDIKWRLGRLPRVRGDAGLLRQVVSNLLSNAVKYTRPKSPAIIEISAERVDGQERVAVKDNGVGFNMNYVGKLFGVFQRLHRAEDFEGTGVGLAIVERVVRRHGGKVWAEGKLGEGASFYFTLPVATSDLDQAPDKEKLLPSKEV